MTLAMSSMLNQRYILNKVSLNRNTHKTRLRTDRLIKCCDQRLADPSPWIFPSNEVSVFANLTFGGLLGAGVLQIM